MMRIRKLALKISNEVVIWASPGSKEWAEGLAREVAFIESDWAALRWSLGSIRVVFDRRETPIGSLDEIPGRFTEFANFSIYARAALWWPIIQGPFTALELLIRRNVHSLYGSSSLGTSFIIFACVCMLIVWLIERQRLKRQMTDDVMGDVLISAMAYKTALARHCSFIWIPTIVITLFWAGRAMEQGGFRAHPFLSSIYIVIGISYVLALRLVQRIFQRRIERLDVLLAERSGAISMDDVG
jgi:hypothetical protein